ncbi:MAG: glycerol-3-phosphate dehydrogenase [Candidatus Paraimprobicoccus trichonymphae]|uniref:Glycerol-3-phosphate dehydrogenase n=1 Tax=Candidatus Paraimprobicoccus trichonymphae TaxID=3033793 RepID=A0AA48KWC9_9FIRM|nr:MAG: glycerol-3-phosphate dehydrogenase [Candidatus Paraimprobicoccus trichonymphae]
MECKKIKVSVIGCGRWGSFLSWYLSSIGQNVILWGRYNSENLNNLLVYRRNDNVFLDEKINIISDLEKSVNMSDILAICINSQSLRSFMKELSKYSLKSKIIILCMKGLEEFTGKRLTQVIEDYVYFEKTSVAILVGPGHVQNLTQGIPTCMVIDSLNYNIKKLLIEQFSSKLIRFYYGTDLIGNEVGAASKNVIGIASGMLDGLNYESLKGPLMSRGAKEIANLIKFMGGNEMSAYGLCHLGDYQATLFSKHSHNRQFGENFVKNINYKKIAEGISTAKALVKLGLKYKISVPICNSVYNIVCKNANPKKELLNLFLKPVKNEI